jgi:hypothetical protein
MDKWINFHWYTGCLYGITGFGFRSFCFPRSSSPQRKPEWFLKGRGKMEKCRAAETGCRTPVSEEIYN